jgi:hypothetical protein
MLALTNSQFKADIPLKPKVLPVQSENVPSEIKTRRRWVVWRCEVRQDKKGPMEMDQGALTGVPAAPG